MLLVNVVSGVFVVVAVVVVVAGVVVVVTRYVVAVTVAAVCKGVVFAAVSYMRGFCHSYCCCY